MVRLILFISALRVCQFENLILFSDKSNEEAEFLIYQKLGEEIFKNGKVGNFIIVIRNILVIIENSHISQPCIHPILFKL